MVRGDTHHGRVNDWRRLDEHWLKIRGEELFLPFTLKYKVLFVCLLFKFKHLIMAIQNKRLIGILLTVVILLLIPFIAMQFTNEVKWGPSDFAVAAVLLFGTGLLCELVLRKVRAVRYRIILCVVLLTALLLVWLELAVGIFGTPFAGQ